MSCPHHIYNVAMRSVLVLMLVTSVAWAGAEEDEVARAHFLSGQAYYEQASYENALRAFREAYRVSKRPALQYNIALCHERLGDLDGAIAALERYLAEMPTAPDRVAVEVRIKNLRSQKPPPSPAPVALEAPPPVE